jgi:hypothetical protein
MGNFVFLLYEALREMMPRSLRIQLMLLGIFVACLTQRGAGLPGKASLGFLALVLFLIFTKIDFSDAEVGREMPTTKPNGTIAGD